jgi:hypothetical protein
MKQNVFNIYNAHRLLNETQGNIIYVYAVQLNTFNPPDYDLLVSDTV